MSRCRPAHLAVVALACALALPSASLAAAPVPAPVPVSPANQSVIADYQSVIEYTAGPGTTVTFELDGVALAPLVPFADGAVDYFPLTPLALGWHTVRARATDALGATSPWSPTTGFWVVSASSGDGSDPGDSDSGNDDSADPGDDTADVPDVPIATTATTPASTDTPPPTMIAPGIPPSHTPLEPAIAITNTRLDGSVLAACAPRAHHCLEQMASLSLSVSRAATIQLALVRSGATLPTAIVTLAAPRGGRVSHVLRARFGGRSLPPGVYKLVIVATAKLGGARSTAVRQVAVNRSAPSPRGHATRRATAPAAG
jgi:hypothetical protein